MAPPDQLLEINGRHEETRTPDLYRVNWAMFSLFAGESDYSGMLRDLAQAEAARPGGKCSLLSVSPAEIRGMKGKVQFLQGHYDEAIASLEQAIRMDVSKAVDVFNLGTVKPEDSSPSIHKLSRSDIDVLVEKFPRDYRPYLFRGLFLQAFTTFDEKYYPLVASDLRRARDLAPSSALPLYYLGALAEKMTFWSKSAWQDIANEGGYRDGGRDRALRFYYDATDADPDFTEAHLGAANCLFALRRYKEAILYYDRVIELSPNSAGAFNDRGLAKENIGDFYGAKEDLSVAIRLKQSQKELELSLESTLENRARVYAKLKDFDKALGDYNKTIASKFASQTILMNPTQIKRLYPELKDIPELQLVEEIRQKYYPGMESKKFADHLAKNEKRYSSFVLSELYALRGDVYLSRSDFSTAATEYARALAEESSTTDRWRLLSKNGETDYFVDGKTITFSTGRKGSIWLKSLNSKTQRYDQQNYELDCTNRRIKLVGGTRYDREGNVLYSIQEQSWQNVVPESMGEALYAGMCGAH